MDARDLDWLRSDAGERALALATARIAEGATELAILDRLRRDYTPEQARDVLALLEGRRSARVKFEDAARLFFDRESAEQASAEVVARHTAARFAGSTRIADLGCGAGGDALALAAHAPVLAVDRDPVRLALVVITPRPAVPSAQLRLILSTPHDLSALSTPRATLATALAPTLQRHRLSAASA